MKDLAEQIQINKSGIVQQGTSHNESDALLGVITVYVH